MKTTKDKRYNQSKLHKEGHEALRAEQWPKRVLKPIVLLLRHIKNEAIENKIGTSALPRLEQDLTLEFSEDQTPKAFKRDDDQA